MPEAFSLPRQLSTVYGVYGPPARAAGRTCPLTLLAEIHRVSAFALSRSSLLKETIEEK